MFPDYRSANKSTENKAISSGEQKSYAPPEGLVGEYENSFVDYLYDQGLGDLAAYLTISMYKKVMPLFNAISLRAETLSQIPIRVRDKKTGKFIEDHDALALLEKPNADVSQMEFMEQLASFYDITGEAFIFATGRLEKPPLEIATIGPQLTNFCGNGNKFGVLNVPDYIRVDRVNTGQMSFESQDVRDYGLRYVDAVNNNELWHIRSFNPTRTGTRFRGMSPVQPILLELQQYMEGNVNNLANLQRGTRISMAWVNNRGEELTETQWARLQEEAQKYKGARNAGGTPVLDGMDVKSIQQTNKDLEFEKLMQVMFSRISNVYRIPLALLLPDTMTLNNLETATLQLLDNAALPLANRIYGELTRFLMPRFKGSENLEFAYNENDIPALRQRIIQSAKTQGEVNVNTVDELRTILGDEPLPIGGNEVFRPAGMIPIGQAIDEGNNDSEDEVASVASTSQEADQNEVAVKNYKLALYEKGFTSVEVKSMTQAFFTKKE